MQKRKKSLEELEEEIKELEELKEKLKKVGVQDITKPSSGNVTEDVFKAFATSHIPRAYMRLDDLRNWENALKFVIF